jgi:ribosomal protein S18 acetylase RimI-like enzyme
MNAITVQNHTSKNIEQLRRLFTRYVEAYPDAKLLTPEFYTYHPASEHACCVVDEQGRVRGFAPLIPVPVTVETAPEDPHQFWTIMIVDPQVHNDLPIRELLLEQVLRRAHEMARHFPPHPVRVSADYMISQKAEIDFLLKHGFARYEGMFLMQHDLVPLSSEIPPLPEGLSVRPWRLAGAADQQRYLTAYNRCFPADPKSLETLEFLLTSPAWADGGAAMTVFDRRQQIAASVMVYRDPSQPYAMTDDVFVLPEWRGKGLAKHLIHAGHRHLREHGVSEVRLEVKQSNRPAVSLYLAMGYAIINEEVFVGRFLESEGNGEL